MKKRNLTINLITKENEVYLKQCLDSIKELECDVVIVFTGNKESNEYELCKKYFDKSIYEYTWNNDFSKARNFAIEKSTTDWIMWIDSDEYIIKDSIQKIKDLVDNNPKNLYHTFKLIHGSSRMGQIRMFFNNPEIRWKNKIHERIIPKNYPKNHYDIEIYHNVHDNIQSHIRNISILEQEVEFDPNNPENHFYLAIEYHLIDKQMKALYHAERFLYNYNITQVDVKKIYMRYLIAWIYTNEIEQYKKAIDVLFGQLVLNCNIAEFWCLLGDIYIKMKNFNNASKYYTNAIEMGEYKYENMWITDLVKYDQYPKSMIEVCKRYKNIDIISFKKDIIQPIIP